MVNTLTKLADLVNPEVLAPIVSYEFKQAMRFTPLASVDSTLQGRSGDTLKFPAFTYIGDAQDVADVAQNALVNGTKFEVLGVQIIESNKVTAGQAIFIKVNPSVPALKLVMKRSAEVENQRNIINKTTVLTADEHYTAYLYDPTKVVVAKASSNG